MRTLFREGADFVEAEMAQLALPEAGVAKLLVDRGGAFARGARRRGVSGRNVITDRGCLALRPETIFVAFDLESATIVHRLVERTAVERDEAAGIGPDIIGGGQAGEEPPVALPEAAHTTLAQVTDFGVSVTGGFAGSMQCLAYPGTDYLAAGRKIWQTCVSDW